MVYLADEAGTRRALTMLQKYILLNMNNVVYVIRYHEQTQLNRVCYLDLFKK